MQRGGEGATHHRGVQREGGRPTNVTGASNDDDHEDKLNESKAETGATGDGDDDAGGEAEESDTSGTRTKQRQRRTEESLCMARDERRHLARAHDTTTRRGCL